MFEYLLLIIRRIQRCFRLKSRKEFLSLFLILFIAIDALNVHARIYQQAQGQEQEEHLERWKVGHLHTSEIVADHISRTQYQVSDATEHTPVAQAPDIQIKQDGILERIAAYSGRLSATGAIVTLVVRATSSSLVVIL